MSNLLNRKKLMGFLMTFFIFMLIFNYSIEYTFAAPSKIAREDIKRAAEKTIDYYNKTYRKKEFKGILDWPALGLFGFGEDVSGPKWTVNGKNGPYFREEQVKRGIGLSKIKNTDFQRTIIGVCSAGKNPRSFGGINLVEIVKGTMLPNGHFADSVEDRKTGKPVGEELVNAHIFGIISLHCAGEPIPNRDKCLEWLLNQQHHDGGFTWDVKYFDDPEDYKLIESDVDMTAGGLMAMAILGLDEKHPAVKKALKFLKEKQLDNGGFDSWGTENPESCVWVIQALTLLGQDPIGPEWTKQNGENPVTAMLRFQLEDGSFAHVLDEEEMLPIYDNGMSTEQGLYGMASAYNNKCVYDMLHEKYRLEAQKNIFDDFKPGEFGFDEVMELVYDYVLAGYTDGTFKPEKPVTRSEFAKLLVCSLNLKDEIKNYRGSTRFKDINEGHWADNYIGMCVNKGYVKGTSNNTFMPDENITGEQLMVILVRAMGLEDEAKKRSIGGKELTYGYMQIAKEKGFIYEGFKAKENVNRAECGWSLVRLRKALN
ncbi:S-layer homology domain-containing protein [Paramaledivibacter caminithermalis]|jgi:hypothetical protein|uniref:Prenyltransferase and squalene oxidase repeat-containing protein n=1 Tax=Paramaledivibacter caminithermalis (strain DSM 15212 / CIP 107654 / DViRD3) TaxID=1121301 RepID=A0A1M6MVT7_PARC5|nr:S-layer homology domain-containing protein [Paramaledivibacter caminithermalis]SHJ87581.1 Prenyltransferase and squalene oxidase repeat-containing protein [Paramaledivibacter caminithermalis DSM 15212]